MLTNSNDSFLTFTVSQAVYETFFMLRNLITKIVKKSYYISCQSILNIHWKD